MVKGQSGKSRKTKVVSARIENATHARLVKKAGGKRKLTQHIKNVLWEASL